MRIGQLILVGNSNHLHQKNSLCFSRDARLSVGSITGDHHSNQPLCAISYFFSASLTALPKHRAIFSAFTTYLLDST